MRLPVVATVVTTLLAAACGGSGKKTPTGTPPPSGPKTTSVSLADVGLEAASMDRTADACTDFFQYTCGGWLAANEIPADKARYGRATQLIDRNDEHVKAILEELAAKPPGDRLGDFYASCLDEATIEKRGTKSLGPLQKAIDKVKDGKSLQAAIAQLHSHGVGAFFGLGVLPDFADSTTNIIFFDTGGLGLPERDFYVKDEFAPVRTAYQEHLVRLFGLLGKGKASSRLAADVMALETRLAKLTKTGVERRNPMTMYNPTDLAGLSKAAPGFDWAAYFTARGNAAPGKINVTTPDFVAGMSAVMKDVKPEAWRAYLTVRLVSANALGLPRAFDEELFTLQKALSGVEARPERWKRCVEVTSYALSETLGQVFVERHFPGDSKTQAVTLVGAITAAMNQQMGTLEWMSAETKVQARGKLAKIEALIGYPDSWRTYDFAVTREDFATNVLLASAFEEKRQFTKAGKPYDRSEWLMPAFMVNAYYNPLANNTALPAGILQPPFFAAGRGIPANLGGIGMVVGHELTHGFDDQGAQFDAQGNLKNWWQPSDLTSFQGKGQCLAKQYSTFEVLPGKFVNGELTLGENIADLGGIKHAFLAYRSLRAGADTVFVADGLSEDQQFFVAVGQAWCSKDRPEEALKRLTDDVHAPPRWRVNGALRNLPQFAAAFGCKKGQQMAPAETCTIW
jgi:putative endopeptidase